MSLPILYSFRRCPYAMRARLGILASGISVELREIILRDKPDHMLEVSPKGTVPVLILGDGRVVDESLDIMTWALGENDPKGIMAAMPDAAWDLIAEQDTEFKPKLDRYKYPNKYPEEGRSQTEARDRATPFLAALEARLAASDYLFGDQQLMVDLAIAPFIRQFAHVDRDWFYGADYPNLQRWLLAFIDSDDFALIMPKFARWAAGDPPITFP